MKIMIFDHRSDSKRPAALAACLEPWPTTHSQQLYGSSDNERPAELNDQFRERIEANTNLADVLLIHVGKHQHFVKECLTSELLHGKRCLFYSGGSFPSDIMRLVKSDSSSKLHAPVPFTIFVDPAPDWPRSPEAVSLRRWIELVVEGIPPTEATSIAFGDPELERALHELWDMVAAGQPLDVIRIRRDELLGDVWAAKE
jgi:hypothetical protein